MKKIKVYYNSGMEDELESIGFGHPQARVVAGVMRGVAGNVLNGRKNDVIRFQVNGYMWKLTLNKED